MTIQVPPGMMITTRDARLAGHCVRGAKEWFEKFNFDFKQATTEGIPASEIVATGDEQGLRVVRMKIEREQRDGR